MGKSMKYRNPCFPVAFPGNDGIYDLLPGA